MAGPLNRSVVYCLLALSLAAPAQAETLPDPTRPPAALTAARLTGEAPPAPPSPSLQSVIISPKHTMAIINGQTVKLGEKFGDALLVKVTETEVVLRNGNMLQTLKLFPDVEKRPVPRGIHDTPRSQR